KSPTHTRRWESTRREVRSQKPEARSRDRKFEVRSSKFEVRSPKFEVRSPKSEVRRITEPGPRECGGRQSEPCAGDARSPHKHPAGAAAGQAGVTGPGVPVR